MGQTTHYRTRGPTHQPAKPSSSKKNAGNKHRLEHTKTCNQSTRSNKTIAQKDKSANTHKCCANPNHYRIGRNTSINSKIKSISATLILKHTKRCFNCQLHGYCLSTFVTLTPEQMKSTVKLHREAIFNAVRRDAKADGPRSCKMKPIDDFTESLLNLTNGSEEIVVHGVDFKLSARACW